MSVSSPQAAPAVPQAAAPARAGQGWWGLVWQQFRRNRPAVVSLWIIGLLFWLAAWAPVLANGLPWVWKVRDPVTGELQVSYPLLRSLVAPSSGMSVDYLFNWLFFLTLSGPLAALVLWLFSRGRSWPPGVFRRRALYAAAAALLLALAPFIGPGSYRRTATPEEKKAHGQEQTSVYHFFRRYRLDRKNYLARRYGLDRAKGEGVVFTLVAQDPIRPTREVLHPIGKYVTYQGRDYRAMSPEILRQPNLGGIRYVCFTGAFEKLDGEAVRLAGVEGRIVCQAPAAQEALAKLRPGDPVWLAGKHAVQMNDEGQVTAIELLVTAAAKLPAELPTFRHWLGTDGQGRDVLARLIHGARISISVGFIAVAIAVLVGVLVGGLAGYYRGWVDIVVSRLIELVICFPVFFLVITIIAFIEDRSIFHVMLVLGLTGWTGVARLVRGEFLKLADQDFVHAARALGCAGRRIMFRHILPNAMGPVLVSAAFGVAGAVLTESGLAFLGFGAPPPTPTWGEMIRQGYDYIAVGAWWLFFVPGFLIFLTVTVYNLAGDGMRDAMDPRLRR